MLSESIVADRGSMWIMPPGSVGYLQFGVLVGVHV